MRVPGKTKVNIRCQFPPIVNMVWLVPYCSYHLCPDILHVSTSITIQHSSIRFRGGFVSGWRDWYFRHYCYWFALDLPPLPPSPWMSQVPLWTHALTSFPSPLDVTSPIVDTCPDLFPLDVTRPIVDTCRDLFPLDVISLIILLVVITKTMCIL